MFIPNKKKSDIIGKKVKLTKDIKVFAGTFKKGTIVTITELDTVSPSRGYGIRDDEDNVAIECGFSFYKEIEGE